MPGSGFYTAPPIRARLAMPAVAPALSPDSPALEVMTDLATDAAHVVGPDRQIDEALRDMIAFGVRLLIVVRDGDVVGMITSYDITGERPLQVMQDPGASTKPLRHSDIVVADVMTPIGQIRPLRLRWVDGASAGEIEALFRGVGETHLLVAEDEGGGRAVIRGIFSRTRLERQLDGR